MARATRVNFPGAWYHVLNRGTESRAIFCSTRCCEKFIELLSCLPKRFGVRLHGYALMGNHYHLQLESREANLSKALHWLNVSYSVWFNRKYSRAGPLFQGRFKAILHEPAEALKINRYIHLNPVRIAALGGHETRDGAAHEITAQLARRRVDVLEQYHWSSFAFFAGTRAAPAWLCTESILAFFGRGSRGELQKAFRQQLREAAAIGRWETDWKAQVKYTVFFGSAEFVAQMSKLLRGDRDQQTGSQTRSGGTRSAWKSAPPRNLGAALSQARPTTYNRAADGLKTPRRQIVVDLRSRFCFGGWPVPAFSKNRRRRDDARQRRGNGTKGLENRPSKEALS
jgi:putative transposase